MHPGRLKTINSGQRFKSGLAPRAFFSTNSRFFSMRGNHPPFSQLAADKDFVSETLRNVQFDEASLYAKECPFLKYQLIPTVGEQPKYERAILRGRDTSALKGNELFLTVSIGTEFASRTKFAALSKLACSGKPHKITIILADALQRHTLKCLPGNANLSVSELTRTLKQQGDDFLISAAPILSCYTVTFQVIRWSHFLQNPWYHKIVSLILEQVRYLPAFEQAFESVYNDFSKRFYNRYGNLAVDKKVLQSAACQYVVEECASMCMWPEVDAHRQKIELYLGSKGRNQALEEINRRILPYKLKQADCFLVRFKRSPVEDGDNLDHRKSNIKEVKGVNYGFSCQSARF